MAPDERRAGGVGGDSPVFGDLDAGLMWKLHATRTGTISVFSGVEIYSSLPELVAPGGKANWSTNVFLRSFRYQRFGVVLVPCLGVVVPCLGTVGAVVPCWGAAGAVGTVPFIWGAVVPLCAAVTTFLVQPQLHPRQRIVPRAHWLRMRSQSAWPLHVQVFREAGQLKPTLSAEPEPMSALPVAGKNANSIIKIARNAWCTCMDFSCCNDNAVNTNDSFSMYFMECSFFHTW